MCVEEVESKQFWSWSLIAGDQALEDLMIGFLGLSMVEYFDKYTMVRWAKQCNDLYNVCVLHID